MFDVFLSLNENKLRLSCVKKDKFLTYAVDVSPEIVNGAEIANPTAFAGLLHTSMSNMEGASLRNSQFIILAEPKHVHLHFVTLAKDSEDMEAQVVERVRERLGTDFENIYHSYQKIAPFIYQFVGVDKSYLDTWLEIAQKSNMSLKAIVPWISVLPKYLDFNDPCGFLVTVGQKNVVALAELNGVYFCNSYDEEKSVSDIQDLMGATSAFRSDEVEAKVYRLDLDEGTSSTRASKASDGSEDMLPDIMFGFESASGYELHVLAYKLIEKAPFYLLTKTNLLNILSLPATARASTSVMVKTAAVAVASILVLIGGAVFLSLNDRDIDTLPNPQESVLSEQDFSVPDVETPSDAAVEDSGQQGDGSTSGGSDNVSVGGVNGGGDGQQGAEVAEEVLAKYQIRVENGSGIAGVAGKTQGLLKDAGYNVPQVGNASRQNYENTVVQFKEEAQVLKDLLVRDLSKTYTVVVEEAPLAAGASHDILVIVGKN